MPKNSSGFTMIELLAAVVVLGILMGTAVPIVITVMNDQKNQMYVDDAIRLASNMDYKLRSDNKLMVPPRGGCIALNLTYMDNNAFEEAPYGGEYDRFASFVVAKRNAATAEEEYSYYVRLIEKTKSGSYRGIDVVNVNALYDKNARDVHVSNITPVRAISLSDFSEASLIQALAEDYSVSCASMEIVAPEEYG